MNYIPFIRSMPYCIYVEIVGRRCKKKKKRKKTNLSHYDKIVHGQLKFIYQNLIKHYDNT